jgi:NAD(P)-dependent dehydrogenase (short-subunit alcohol dehydrogenase family)
MHSESQMPASQSARYPSLDGRVTIVTGGATGIGAAIVRAFAANRAKVVFLDIQDAPAAALIRDIAAAGHAAPTYVHCDLLDIPAFQATIRDVGARFGNTTVFINNAANDTREPFADVTPDSFDRLIDINLRPHFFAAQAVAPQMRAAGGGSIINVSSGAWVGGIADLQAYSAAKAGIVGLTNSLARQLGPDRIRVNALAPGAVMTERQMRLWHTPESTAAIVDQQCIPELVREADVANAALFLAADESRLITKQFIFVNAGMR